MIWYVEKLKVRVFGQRAWRMLPESITSVERLNFKTYCYKIDGLEYCGFSKGFEKIFNATILFDRLTRTYSDDFVIDYDINSMYIQS